MNDMERLVRPTDKTAKCWRYDISHGATFGPVVLDTPIGGKEVSITLKNRYQLEWRQYGPSGSWKFRATPNDIRCVRAEGPF
jgi:hypothetical protein